MNLRHAFSWLLAGLVMAWALCPEPVLACAACFGKSDSPLAQGMNMGILALLAVITVVLSGVAGFFVYLSRRSAKLTARSLESELQRQTLVLEHD
jgi:heme/copper-type cytochrome/quinol oxidase subunit 2